MTIIYDVVVKRHHTGNTVCLFYDEDREKAIDYMEKYRKRNGFSIEEKGKRYSIADLILREREATGKVISETPYHKLFDTVTDKMIR